MGDMKEGFKFLTEMKKKRHQEWYQKNCEIIKNSGLDFVQKDTVILFRDTNCRIDFYPHTGRWKFEGKMYQGGADKFLKWYKEREEL